MTVAILLAPATRVGYMLYPINFFAWSWLLSSEDKVSPVSEEPLDVVVPVTAGATSAERERVPEPVR
jgi:hypothetical protein